MRLIFLFWELWILEPMRIHRTTMIEWSLENKTPRALKSFNNYDYAFQNDVAVYFQRNFMFCFLLNPPPHHFKVENLKKNRQ